MRRVVLEAHTISITEVKDKKFIGVMWRGSVRGMLIPTKEGFEVLNNNDISMEYTKVYSSKEEFVRDSLGCDAREIYVFESIVELLTWFNK